MRCDKACRYSGQCTGPVYTSYVLQMFGNDLIIFIGFHQSLCPMLQPQCRVLVTDYANRYYPFESVLLLSGNVVWMHGSCIVTCLRDGIALMYQRILLMRFGRSKLCHSRGAVERWTLVVKVGIEIMIRMTLILIR